MKATLNIDVRRRYYAAGSPACSQTKMVLVISHRFANVKNADQIVALCSMVVVEVERNLQELLATNDEYNECMRPRLSLRIM